MLKNQLNQEKQELNLIAINKQPTLGEKSISPSYKIISSIKAISDDKRNFQICKLIQKLNAKKIIMNNI